MELVEGETLENLIKRSGRIEAKSALEIVTQVAAGLAAIHKQKLVHGDIKPSNIMESLGEGGAVTTRIIDLGLAKPAVAAAAAPGSSTQRGTRVSGEEAFDSLGSFLGGLHRISSAQLASLDSIRDRLIDLRWNPRLTSTGQECQVLK